MHQCLLDILSQKILTEIWILNIYISKQTHTFSVFIVRNKPSSFLKEKNSKEPQKVDIWSPFYIRQTYALHMNIMVYEFNGNSPMTDWWIPLTKGQ